MKTLFNAIQALKSISAAPGISAAVTGVKSAAIIIPIVSTIFISNHISTTQTERLEALEDIVTNNYVEEPVGMTSESLSEYLKSISEKPTFIMPVGDIFEASSSNIDQAAISSYPSKNRSAGYAKSLPTNNYENMLKENLPVDNLKISQESYSRENLPSTLNGEKDNIPETIANGVAGSNQGNFSSNQEVFENDSNAETEKDSDEGDLGQSVTVIENDSTSSPSITLKYETLPGAGLSSTMINDIFVDTNGIIYAATTDGLGISYDGGLTFTVKNDADGIGDKDITNVFVDNLMNIYVCTKFGLSISTDAGISFVNRNASSGLGDKDVNDVFVDGGIIYAATKKGLSVSTDGGISFINKNESDGLADKVVSGVYVRWNIIYAATDKGLSISSDGGNSFTSKDSGDGIGDDAINQVFVDVSDNIYVSTSKGMSVSTNGGLSFFNKTIVDGLGDDIVSGVYVENMIIYVATKQGLSVSTDGGLSFINYDETQGLANKQVNGVHIDALDKVFIATIGGISVSKD